MTNELMSLIFEKESQTIKDQYGQIVCSFSSASDSWVVFDKLDYYDEELKFIIKNSIIRNKNESINYLLEVLEKEISLFSKTRDHSVLIDPVIAYEINTKKIKKIRKQIIPLLEEIKKFKAVRSPHISLAYILGEHKLSELSSIINQIENYRVEFKFESVEIVSGMATKFDYIILTLNFPDKLKEIITKVGELIPIRKFINGFKPHITLFILEKDNLESTVKSLDIIRDKIKELLSQEQTFRAEALSVYNNNQKIKIRKLQK